MGHPPRFDKPGRWFHVMNRGLANRTVFESKEDVRFFLSRVARAVRRGELEVHAFCIMTTHFHLLVRSPTGQLSEAMRRIQNEYVRYFNRKNKRDGPLFRGRFHSKPVLSLTYRRILVRYIDENPARAGIVPSPWDYPHGSASRYVEGKVPRWLCPDWILGRVERAKESQSDADYVSVWGRKPTAAERELVQARSAGRGIPDDDLDDLVSAAPAHVQKWMRERAQLADQTRPGIACVPPRVVVEVTDRLKSRGRILRYNSPSGQRREAWGAATAGLLRHLSGQTYREIAERQGVSTAMVTRRVRLHAELTSHADYATRLGRVGVLCIRAAFP